LVRGKLLHFFEVLLGQLLGAFHGGVVVFVHQDSARRSISGTGLELSFSFAASSRIMSASSERLASVDSVLKKPSVPPWEARGGSGRYQILR
jgi:hypothetical protein